MSVFDTRCLYERSTGRKWVLLLMSRETVVCVPRLDSLTLSVKSLKGFCVIIHRLALLISSSLLPLAVGTDRVVDI